MTPGTSRFIGLAALAGALLASATAGAAAQRPVVQPGDRVRVYLPGGGGFASPFSWEARVGWRVATVTSVSADTLVIVPSGTAETLSLPAIAVAEIHLSRGWPGRRRRMLLGGVAGAGAGAAVGLAFAESRLEGDERPDRGRAADVLPVAVVGALAGLYVGWRSTRERWEVASLPRRVGLAPINAGRWAVTVALGTPWAGL